MNRTKNTLLIIEDDEFILDIYTRIFRKEFVVFATHKVDEFFTYYEEKDIDCFIIDLSLGLQKNGIDLINDLRKNEKYRLTPIIVVTAHAFSRDERLAIESGATRFMRKPVENKKLIEEVKTLLNINAPI